MEVQLPVPKRRKAFLVKTFNIIYCDCGIQKTVLLNANSYIEITRGTTEQSTLSE